MKPYGFVNRKIDDTIRRRIGWRGDRLTVYLHIYGKDGHGENQSYHFHPWEKAISLVLYGGLLEDTSRSTIRVVWTRMLRILARKGSEIHRILFWRPHTVTLFVGWKRETAVSLLADRGSFGNLSLIRSNGEQKAFHWSEFQPVGRQPAGRPPAGRQ